MWVIARRMRTGNKTRGTRLIEVLGRQQVSRGAAVAVVRVGDQALIVGVTENQVSVLADTDLAAAQAMLAENQTPARRSGTRRRPAGAAHTVRAQKAAPVTGPATEATTATGPGGLAGSALSPATWKQTVESLRDLTARSR